MRLPRQDLELIGRQSARIWPNLEGRRLFVTGGTGFFGKWMLESLEWANIHLGLQTRATILTRDFAAFASKAPHLAVASCFRFIEGDIRALPPECDSERYDYILHMATDTDAASQQHSAQLLETLILGTRSVLDLARRTEALAVLMTSSGAVYGSQPPEITHIPETYLGAPDPLSASSAYAEGKRVAELLGAMYLAEHALPVKIARCFAFVGPHLPLDGHFAIGNFIRDALAGRPIEISGDGAPYRSYLYAADLAVWLWTLLVDAPAGVAFNVGSSEAVTIAETASAVAQSVSPALPIRIARQPDPIAPAHRYVPSVERAETTLGLRQTVALPEAIARTLAWHRARLAGDDNAS